MEEVPAWAVPLMDGMKALQELPAQMVALQALMIAIEARMTNWNIELPDDEITSFRNQEGAIVPAMFSQTLHHLTILTLLEVNELLEYYGLSIAGGEIDRRRLM
ncbi:hypothetical protein R1flu_001050 [Riccia fluitans]|uniref:Uncharacterized protein n=1 Tax=Riccia fluitans TaxID=41844 RepID=A0ABD1Y287_9MARC